LSIATVGPSHDVVAMRTWSRHHSLRIPHRKPSGDAIERVGLSGCEDRPSATLSGGQRQRVLLAQSLVQQVDVLLSTSRLWASTPPVLRPHAHSAGPGGRAWAVARLTHDDTSIRDADRVLRLEDGHVL